MSRRQRFNLNNLAGNFWRELRFGMGKSRTQLHNFRYRKQNLGFLVLPISGSLPERSAPARSFLERQLPLPPNPLSLQTINYNFKLIADASNVNGIVIILGGLSAGISAIQSLRMAIKRLRAAGKRVVVYTPYLSLANYYVAVSADIVIAPPLTEFSVTGLQTTSTYLKNTLEYFGLKGDFVQISPYKSAMNIATETHMTPEERAQVSWLIDDQFEMLTADFAADRGIDQDTIKCLINWAPFSAREAERNGLIDAAAYEDQIPYLIPEFWPQNRPSQGKSKPRAKLTTIGASRKKLVRKSRRKTRKSIGVLSVTGPISMVPAQSLVPIPGLGNNSNNANERTLTRQIRRVEKDKDIAAAIVYINSPGGDALASDLIWRQIKRLQKSKPVVVYMGSTCASGGYYIAAGGQHIVAHEGTITGSIGVLSGRLSTQDFLRKMAVNQVSVKRGRNAGLYRDSKPFSEDERSLIWARIVETYGMFKQVVATGRDLPYDSLDPICLGRVWTGRQALAKGLVDSHGDFEAAVKVAKQLADLPDDDDVSVPMRNIYIAGKHRLPRPNSAEPLAIPTPNALPAPAQAILEHLQNPTLNFFDGRPLFLLPQQYKFW